jgi:protein-disulfide isomerase
MKSWSAALLVAIAAVGLGTGGTILATAERPAGADFALISSPAMAAEAEAPFSEAEKDEMRKVFRDYLMQNPEILREAMDELQRKEEAAQTAEAAAAISGDKRIFSSKRQVVLGNPDGDVTLVEFFDYNCGYCKRAHADMKRLLDEDKNLRVVLKEFPILSQGSMEAAQVGVAVNMIAPERYFEFHDALISERGQVNGARAMEVAEDLGLDAGKLKEMAQSAETKATLDEVRELGDKLAISGTPSYVTQKELVVGAVGYDTLKAKIDEARKACADTPC